MTDAERRREIVRHAVELLVASTIRLGWDAREIGIPREQAAADAVAASQPVLDALLRLIEQHDDPPTHPAM